MFRYAKKSYKGAGIVGQSFVAALAHNNYFQESGPKNITVLDLREPPSLEKFQGDIKEEIPMHRTFTLSPSSVEFLENVGVVDKMNMERFREYYHMQVWEKQGSSFLTFNGENGEGMGRTVENDHLTAALYSHLKENVNFFFLNFFSGKC